MCTPGPNDTDQYWEGRYHDDFGSPRDWRFVIFSPVTWKRFRQEVPFGSRGMDLGAGGGTLTYALRCEGLQCLALEKSPGGLTSARHLISSNSILGGDVLRVPVRNCSLDFAVSSMVIEHVDDSEMVRELFRILKPGGIVMVTSVLKKSWAWYWKRNARGEIVIDDTHLREYHAPHEFNVLFEKAGFEILSLQTPSIRFPLIDPLLKLLHRLKPNGFWTIFPTSVAGNFLRLMTRIPLLGYHSIEVIARKRAVE